MKDTQTQHPSFSSQFLDFNLWGPKVDIPENSNITEQLITVNIIVN